MFFASFVSIHILLTHTNISNVSTNYSMKPFSKIFRQCEDLLRSCTSVVNISLGHKILNTEKKKTRLSVHVFRLCDTVSLYYLYSFLVLRNQNWLHSHRSGFSDNLKIAQFFPQSNLRKKVQVVSCDGGQAVETLSFVFTYKTRFSIAILLMTSL